jgi:hypothetical protein
MFFRSRKRWRGKALPQRKAMLVTPNADKSNAMPEIRYPLRRRAFKAFFRSLFPGVFEAIVTAAIYSSSKTSRLRSLDKCVHRAVHKSCWQTPLTAL